MSIFTGTAGTDNFAGEDSAGDVFSFTAATLGSGDTVLGGGLSGDPPDTLEITGPGSIDTSIAEISGIERVLLGADARQITLGKNILTSSAAGTLTVLGTASNDHVLAFQGKVGTDDAIAFSGEAGNDLIVATWGDDTLSGGAGNDNLNGARGADSIDGGDGNDRLTGGSGSVLSGGAGDDIINVSRILDSATIDGGDGLDFVQFDKFRYPSSVVLTGVEGLIGVVYATPEQLDTFSHLRTGAVGLTAAGRIDFSDLVEAPRSLNINALPYITGNLEIIGTVARNGIAGARGNDTLTGNADADVLNGMRGNDVLSGGGGNDDLSGWQGNDSLDGGDAFGNPLSSLGPLSIRNIERLDIGQTFTARADQLAGLSSIYVTGFVDPSVDFTISGSGTVNLGAKLKNYDGPILAMGTGRGALGIAGTASGDTIIGGLGDDTLNGGGGNDVLANRPLDFAGIDVFAGADLFIGGAGNDTIFAEGHGDSVRAGAGNDEIHGKGIAGLKAGANVVGGAGFDTLIDHSILGTVTQVERLVVTEGQHTLEASIAQLNQFRTIALPSFLDLPMTFTVSGPGTLDLALLVKTNQGLHVIVKGASTATIIAPGGNDTIEGGRGGDSIAGGGGGDRLIGGAGDDTLAGGGGNDVYVVGGGSDVFREIATGGIADSVESAFTCKLGANIEYLLLTGTGNTGGTGNGLDNIIVGNDGDNLLDGRAGDDTIRGGLGNDTVTGSLGADTFSFTSGLDAASNVDAVTDFTVGEDVMRLSRSIFGAFTGPDVNAGDFIVGTEALTAAQNLIYDSDTGNLFYDSDAAGGGAQVLFAILAPGLALTHEDFVLI